MLQGFRGRFAEKSIRVHITTLYLAILVGSILLSNMLYQRIYAEMALRRVSEASMQTLNSIQANLDASIRNANNYSKIILSDADVQALLATGDLYSDIRLQGRIRSFLYKVVQDASDIASVYLFDNSGNSFSINNRSDYESVPVNIREAAWYREAISARGSYFLRLNGDGVFSESAKENSVSLIRSVRDINTTESIGVLVINISETAFRQAYEGIGWYNASRFFLLDENGNGIVRSSQPDAELLEALHEADDGQEQGTLRLRLNKEQHLVSRLREANHGWKLISMMPVSQLSAETTPAFMSGFMVILFNGVLLFVGAILVSGMITSPINKLLHSMKQVETGVLEEWDIRAGNREISQLQEHYNLMIGWIRELIEKVVAEQRTKRKNELSVLQAQIKPHFLYNTLDSINALALMGDTEGVVRVVDALGVYYRLSLGHGREVVTVGEEVEMVRNYLAIQKMRYGDLFEDLYDLDPAASSAPLLKLVLQPLVENAIYHGIRESGHNGTICIRTRLEEEAVCISISDNGAGISPERLERLMQGEEGIDSGFGLRGTIERMRMFCGRQDVFIMESRPGEGTEITLRYPLAAVKETEL